MINIFYNKKFNQDLNLDKDNSKKEEQSVDDKNIKQEMNNNINVINKEIEGNIISQVHENDINNNSHIQNELKLKDNIDLNKEKNEINKEDQSIDENEKAGTKDKKGAKKK